MSAAAQPTMGDPPDRGGSFDSSALVDSPAANPSPMPNLKEKSKGVVSQFRTLHGQLDDLAQQFPAGAKELKKAQDALKESMVKILSELQRPAQGGPQAG